MCQAPHKETKPLTIFEWKVGKYFIKDWNGKMVSRCHNSLPVEILRAAQELQASEENVAEVFINTKPKLNFAN